MFYSREVYQDVVYDIQDNNDKKIIDADMLENNMREKNRDHDDLAQIQFADTANPLEQDMSETDSSDEHMDLKHQLEMIFKENGEISKIRAVNEAIKKKKIEKLKQAMYKSFHQEKGEFLTDATS